MPLKTLVKKEELQSGGYYLSYFPCAVGLVCPHIQARDLRTWDLWSLTLESFTEWYRPTPFLFKTGEPYVTLYVKNYTLFCVHLYCNSHVTRYIFTRAKNNNKTNIYPSNTIGWIIWKWGTKMFWQEVVKKEIKHVLYCKLFFRLTFTVLEKIKQNIFTTFTFPKVF
jgi:hypothetical protein